MLPEGRHVRAVHDVVLPSMPEGAVWLDCSTIDVATTQELARLAHERDVEFVDAPVSGGPEGAGSGSLSFMVGGPPAAVERVRPLLDIMGQRTTVFGEAGMGQAAKACHNMIVGITGLAVFEGFALAEALGLDAERFHALCSSAAAACWTLENRCPVPGVVESAPSSNDYTPGFAARLMAKDLGLAQAAADSVDLETDFGRQAAERFSAFVDDGNGDLDYSAFYRTLHKGSS
jgi:3-hydroxyisobutyrate dehydrogenase